MIESLESRVLFSAPPAPTNLSAYAEILTIRDVKHHDIHMHFRQPAIPKGFKFFEYVIGVDNVAGQFSETANKNTPNIILPDVVPGREDYISIAIVVRKGPKNSPTFAESAFSAGVWIKAI